MKIQRESSDAFQSPSPLAFQLPPQILERAANGLCWVSLICAVSSVALTLIQHLLQPEFADPAIVVGRRNAIAVGPAALRS